MRNPSRLLTTLSYPSAHSPLLPTYAHVHSPGAAPAPSLSPPYQHSTDPVKNGSSSTGKQIKSARRYALLEKERRYEREWTEWLAGVIRAHGEKRVGEMWEECIKGMEEVRREGTRIPEVAFHNLANDLASASTVESLRSTGIVLVRDVISDQKAEYVGKELIHAAEERSGASPFWHPYLLALRSHPSVLSANSQIMHALTGSDAKYIKAESTGILPRSVRSTVDVENPWKSPSPLSAHLALSQSPNNAYTTLPSTHSALYTALRPLFKPLRSRISFYDSEGYLDRSNWAIVNPLDTPSSSSRTDIDEELKLPHITSFESVSVPEIRPGDVIYRHASLPIHSTSAASQVPPISDEWNAGALFLPVSPLGSDAAELVQRQRMAFERGLPPDHAGLEGSVQMEEEGQVEDLGGRSGRGVMGYA